MPLDPEENKRRAERAEKALRGWLGDERSDLDPDDDRDTVIQDLFSDLMHFCGARQPEWTTLLGLALTNYRAETDPAAD